ncbi:uncharacterized protein LOC110188698 [Drosophila serrata]|uniref:uncharacterized protein LOC110188698 n=1 Tax=Drosophila serrata TaxID=7274 RepID=UPI000A1D1EE3|nr:uncharacterized protein LOC110188698 [Drosophila serrata]
MNTVLNILLLISFYFLAVTLHLVWCDDVPSAEAEMVITQSEPRHSTPDDFDI